MSPTTLLPTIAALGFLLFTTSVVRRDGPASRHGWLFPAALSWYLVAPQAKALGMRLAPWLALIVCTGCIGLLALTARLLYLRERSTHG